jgi:hypothetical protein
MFSWYRRLRTDHPEKTIRVSGGRGVKTPARGARGRNEPRRERGQVRNIGPELVTVGELCP